MLLNPSPKFHDQDVGLPVDISENCTLCPRTGELGLYEKSAVKVEDVATEIILLWLCEFDPLETVRVTLYEPAWAKIWLGFREVLVDPSLKVHDHEVGDPEEVSVNCTGCPATGDKGL